MVERLPVKILGMLKQLTKKLNQIDDIIIQAVLKGSRTEQDLWKKCTGRDSNCGSNCAVGLGLGRPMASSFLLSNGFDVSIFPFLTTYKYNEYKQPTGLLKHSIVTQQ